MICVRTPDEVLDLPLLVLQLALLRGNLGLLRRELRLLCLQLRLLLVQLRERLFQLRFLRVQFFLRLVGRVLRRLQQQLLHGEVFLRRGQLLLGGIELALGGGQFFLGGIEGAVLFVELILRGGEVVLRGEQRRLLAGDVRLALLKGGLQYDHLVAALLVVVVHEEVLVEYIEQDQYDDQHQCAHQIGKAQPEAVLFAVLPRAAAAGVPAHAHARPPLLPLLGLRGIEAVHGIVDGGVGLLKGGAEAVDLVEEGVRGLAHGLRQLPEGI